MTIPLMHDSNIYSTTDRPQAVTTAVNEGRLVRPRHTGWAAGIPVGAVPA